MNTPTVAVLFARANSVYKTIPGCDVYDLARDARTFPGGLSVVAHPPCRAWGRLRNMPNVAPGIPADEKDMARWAIAQVREQGGVLEHPFASSLWSDQSLPRPGCGADAHGGFSLYVLQKWWGHRADKATWLYVCGIHPRQVPATPLTFHESPCVVASGRYRRGDPRGKPHCTKAEREHTPLAFAQWLLSVARTCRSQNI